MAPQRYRGTELGLRLLVHSSSRVRNSAQGSERSGSDSVSAQSLGTRRPSDARRIPNYNQVTRSAWKRRERTREAGRETGNEGLQGPDSAVGDAIGEGGAGAGRTLPLGDPGGAGRGGAGLRGGGGRPAPPPEAGRWGVRAGFPLSRVRPPPVPRAVAARAPPLLEIRAAARAPRPAASGRERASARFSCQRRKGGAVRSPPSTISVSRVSSSRAAAAPAPRSSLSGGLALRAPHSAPPRPLLRAASAGARGARGRGLRRGRRPGACRPPRPWSERRRHPPALAPPAAPGLARGPAPPAGPPTPRNTPETY